MLSCSVVADPPQISQIDDIADTPLELYNDSEL